MYYEHCLIRTLITCQYVTIESLCKACSIWIKGFFTGSASDLGNTPSYLFNSGIQHRPDIYWEIQILICAGLLLSALMLTKAVSIHIEKNTLLAVSY